MEYPFLERNKPKMRREIVEEHPCLVIGNLGRGLLRREVSERGIFAFRNSLNPLLGEFVVSRSKKGLKILIFFKGNPEGIEIKIGTSHVTFGPKPYFTCPGCASLRNHLYLKNRLLRCRLCLRLVHESTRYLSPLVLPLKKHLKIRELEASILRITYANRYTKKARRLMALCGAVTVPGSQTI